MATDATGTVTSPDSIPTFNTAVDSPSGLGSNAQMAAIQAALTARAATAAAATALKANKPAGGTGVKIWNSGTLAWDDPTGTPTGAKFLRDDGSWQTASTAAPTPATSLPGSPTNGQTAILTDSTTAPTYNWLFQYDTTISDANKWRFLGGVPYHVNGLSLTVPRAGDYLAEIGALGRAYSSNETQGLAITAGGTSLVAKAGTSGGAASPPWGSTFDARKMTGLTAAQVLTVTDNGSITAANPFIRITPIRVA